MRGINSNSIDLIYLDPPYNSNRRYLRPIGGKDVGFKDIWTADDVDYEWVNRILAAKDKRLSFVIQSALASHGTSMFSYLAMMAERLIEIRRILKPNGSVYVHADDTAAAYLRVVMDTVFGKDWFKNEITWKRTSAHNNTGKYGRISDRILFYAGDGATWNDQYMAHDESYVERAYRVIHPKYGRCRLSDLTGAGRSGGECATPWKGVDPCWSNRTWSVPKTGKLAEWIEENVIPGYRQIESVHERLDKLDAAGLIHHSKNGGVSMIRPLASTPGKKVQDIWTDIQPVTSTSRENTRFPTQKPLSLLKRIILASSNPGDWVLDPFAGCATCPVAAEQQGRQWIGIDKSDEAVNQVVMRLGKLYGGKDGLSFNARRMIKHRDDIPVRTDLGKLPHPRSHLKHLYGECGGYCAGCGKHFEPELFHVDHVVARAVGGQDNIENLQLLCPRCNGKKGKDSMAKLRVRLRESGLELP